MPAVRRLFTSGLALSLLLGLAACASPGSGADDDGQGASASAPVTSGEQAADNDGAGIPTRALTQKQAAERLLTLDQFPGGTIASLKATRVGVSTLRPAAELAKLDVDEQCKAAIAPISRTTLHLTAGARVVGKLEPYASVGAAGGNVNITLFAQRRGGKSFSALDDVADACVGTVSGPDSVTAVQRGLSGATFVLGGKKKAVTVAAGDWGANHLVVIMHGVDPDTAQQILDAQLAKLAAPVQ